MSQDHFSKCKHYDILLKVTKIDLKVAFLASFLEIIISSHRLQNEKMQ